MLALRILPLTQPASPELGLRIVADPAGLSNAKIMPDCSRREASASVRSL